jgi:transposase-like protein
MEVPKGRAPSIDYILMACPACKAWPMAANLKPSWNIDLQFTCPQCHFAASAATMSEARTLPADAK